MLYTWFVFLGRMCDYFDVNLITLPAYVVCILYVYRGFSLFGSFIIMIYKIFAVDMLRFTIIFIVFLVQFSLGMTSSDINRSESTI